MKHTQEVFVHYQKDGDYVFRPYDSTPYNPEYVLVNKQVIEFDVPDDFNPTPKLVENLEAIKAELHRQFAMKVNEINDQISKLQCLTYEVPA
jgi:hypothetical protein